MTGIHEQQAQQFLAWHRKGSAPWDEAFAQWAASKDFSPVERMAISSVVLSELVASGEAVVTDPCDLYGAGAA